MGDELKQRVTAVEVKVDKIQEDFTEHEQLNRASFDKLGKRIDKFMNNEVHHLQLQIDAIKKHNGMTRTDWVKILTATIVVTGTVIVALIQYGVIG